jgi:hypothetical protein
MAPKFWSSPPDTGSTSKLKSPRRVSRSGGRGRPVVSTSTIRKLVSSRGNRRKSVRGVISASDHLDDLAVADRDNLAVRWRLAPHSAGTWVWMIDAMRSPKSRSSSRSAVRPSARAACRAACWGVRGVLIL